MARARHPIVTFNVPMGDAIFHIIQMPTRVRTGLQVAATLEITGPGGSFDRGTETTYQYLVTVTQGGRTIPLETWTSRQFQEFVTRATGIADQTVDVRRRIEEKD